MGNQQSNEPKRDYKIYKITRKTEYSDWIRYYLDDFVPYNDGNHKSIDFEKHSTGFIILLVANNIIGDGKSDLTVSFAVGDYIKIDLEMTRRNSCSHNFFHSKEWLVGRVMWDESTQQNIIATTGEWCQEILEHRELRADAMQDYRAFQQANEWHTKP